MLRQNKRALKNGAFLLRRQQRARSESDEKEQKTPPFFFLVSGVSVFCLCFIPYIQSTRRRRIGN